MSDESRQHRFYQHEVRVMCLQISIAPTSLSLLNALLNGESTSRVRKKRKHTGTSTTGFLLPVHDLVGESTDRAISQSRTTAHFGGGRSPAKPFDFNLILPRSMKEVVSVSLRAPVAISCLRPGVLETQHQSDSHSVHPFPPSPALHCQKIRSPASRPNTSQKQTTLHPRYG